ncbi:MULTISPECIES: DNA helicase RecQ [unclassified Shewanella]|uniref:DNA helicase RecQ n=1 Tax=unclassified Shewanella TaxID=196818 RepID=UPI001BC03238|nr:MULTISPECIES: DNA helicase RecQ [unclassified Shewanella]GIU11576.1 ATP-dependent DNA helicase RecQ [Shewanella sp. MBTL60-112-B1]GIU31335.1 ATP-dependent DNA helicase RecQ [Shewanella sp. MBTL60-112-B2]
MDQAALDTSVDQLSSTLQSVFGYRTFREGQREVIEQICAGQDCLVIMPTGGGKSLCYQLPALVLPGLTVVVSPLISLMKDQVDSLIQTGVSAAYLNSSQPREESLQVLQKMRYGELKLLYVSPERLLQASFIDRLHELNVSLFAIDEAHCISQWGHDFRPEYAALGRLRQQFPQVPIMALTATADKATRADICERLTITPHSLLTSFDRPNIRYTVAEKLNAANQLRQFVDAQNGTSGIVYCSSRRRVDEVAERLRLQGHQAEAYHAGKTQEERADVQDRFLKDQLDIVVATVAFGMGINKSNVRYVVHYDIPKSVESYYQETGRAGRDGLDSEALMLFDPADIGRVRHLIEQSEPGPQQQVEFHKLNTMAAFAEAQTCRRQVLLHYFDEPALQACGNCDICLDPPKKYNGIQDAQKVLSCIYRIGQRFGINHLIEVLRGSKSASVIERGHDKLSTWGIGKEKSHEHWLSVIRQLIHLGLANQDITRGSSVTLNPSARAVLKGEVELLLAEPRIVIQTTKRRSTNTRAPLNYDRKLFARLKLLRRTLAEELDVPPYLVFNDATLAEMAAILPTSPGEMLAVNGVGERKLERFGGEFLDEIADYLAEG